MADDRYAFIQRLLHWLIAILVLGALLGGWMIGEFASKDLPDGVYNQIYALHKNVGVVILGLMICRILARLTYGEPAKTDAVTGWQQKAATFVHVAFYALLILQPILGILGVWAYPAPIPILDGLTENPLVKDRDFSKQLLDFHEIIGKALIVLALIHIGAAVMHIFKNDRVLRRISLRR